MSLVQLRNYRKWTRRSPVIIFVTSLMLLLLACLCSWHFAPQPVLAQHKVASNDAIEQREASLNPQGELREIHLSAQGKLLISDVRAGEIWQVTPATGDYIKYVGLDAVQDAQSDPNGNLWWSNGADGFGRINLANNLVTTWTISSTESVQLSGLVFEESGRLWLSEWFGTTSKFYRFDPSKDELCVYAMPYGVSSNYLRYQNGKIWLINWAQAYVVRYDPSSSQVTIWETEQKGLVEGLTFDEAGQIWWAATEQKTLNRLDPVLNVLTTYPLPVGTEPHALVVHDERIWYTEGVSGTVGSLDPQSSAASRTILTPFTLESTTTCSNLTANNSATLTPQSGVLQWQDNRSTLLYGDPQWTIYQLPVGASPFGMLFADGYLWVTDRGIDRQKLVRLNIVNRSVYLPLVLR